MTDIYNILAGMGRNGDTELAHITEKEADILKLLGGSGTINPKTGLSEYHRQDATIDIDGSKKRHNERHSSGEFLTADTHATRNSPEGLKILAEGNAMREGEELLGSDQTFASGLGKKSLTASQYSKMTPQEIVDHIFKEQYGGQVPAGMNMTIDEFKQNLAGRLSQAPEYAGVNPKEIELLKTQGALTRDKSLTALQESVPSNISSLNQRDVIGARGKIGKGFTSTMDQYDFTMDKGIYGLEKAYGQEWETQYSQFLEKLPDSSIG